MNVIIWLVVGGAMGWMAHRIMKTDGRQGAGPNVLVGIVGGFGRMAAVSRRRCRYRRSTRLESCGLLHRCDDFAGDGQSHTPDRRG